MDVSQKQGRKQSPLMKLRAVYFLSQRANAKSTLITVFQRFQSASVNITVFQGLAIWKVKVILNLMNAIPYG